LKKLTFPSCSYFCDVTFLGSWLLIFAASQKRRASLKFPFWSGTRPNIATLMCFRSILSTSLPASRFIAVQCSSSSTRVSSATWFLHLFWTGLYPKL
jgi:hypothetical protein